MTWCITQTQCTYSWLHKYMKYTQFISAYMAMELRISFPWIEEYQISPVMLLENNKQLPSCANINQTTVIFCKMKIFPQKWYNVLLLRGLPSWDWHEFWAPGSWLHASRGLNSSPPAQNGRHFSRRHFQMHFLEWKWKNSDWTFTEICSQESY